MVDQIISDDCARTTGGSGGRRVAVLIACKNGEATIGNAVRSAVGQADVFVVSDGSTDGTVREAQLAGARVLIRRTSAGKPAALRAGNAHFELARRYEYVAVLDDDTVLAAHYMERVLAKIDGDEDVAAASGRIDSIWDHAHRWNPLIAHDAPYAIDDMYWLAEIARKRMGRVAYVHDARSWTIDPHRLGDWYRQTLRWCWGQFQSIRGHRLGIPVRRGGALGVRFSWFDAAYLLLLVDWLAYALEPVLIVPVAYWFKGWIDPIWFPILYVATSGAWIAVAAAALRKPRLVLLIPAILALDLVYRVAMLHAVAKTALWPRIETCRWDSPARFELD